MSPHPLRGDGSPAVTSNFVGRHAELQRIGTLLASSAPLISLVGPGGIGKTRLVAEAMSQHRGTGQAVHWVRLTRLPRDADTAVVAEEVVQAISRTDLAARSAWDVLVSTLSETGAAAGNRTLLVLDNCEHVLMGVSQLAASLLDALPNLTILATSREPLGWIDEHIITVPPLSPEQALRLFRQRAALTGRAVADNPEQLANAQQICRHVDHNPLFIRLAAARLLHQPPALVLRELTGGPDDKRMSWSHGPRAGSDERHRGVRDVIAWSYGLCDPTEQLLLDRMSVFAAGYETHGSDPLRNGTGLDAIASACADAELPPELVEPTLERLVERSLVSAHITFDTVHYYLLESVRIFARDELSHRGDDARRTAQQHRRYYRDRVISGQSAPSGISEQAQLDWVRAAWDNIITAIETSLSDPTEALTGLEIATNLMALRMQFTKGANQAITRLTERALDASRTIDPPPTRLRVTATALIGWIALWQGRSAYTAQLLDECVAVCVSDPRQRANWRDSAKTDIGLPAAVEWTWGLDLMLSNLDSRAITVLDRARYKYAELGDLIGATRSELFVAFSSAFVGDRQQALENTEYHLGHAVTSGSDWSIAWAEIARSIALTKHGQVEEALRLAHTALADHLSTGDTWTESWAAGARIVALVQHLADRLASGQRNAETTAAATEIARLVGGFKIYHRSMGVAIERVPMIAAEIRRAVDVATAVTGPDAYAAAERQGAQLRPEFDELRQCALGTLPADRLPTDIPTIPARTSRWETLTRAEKEVAALAAAGWPNSAIATRRNSSIRTVDTQVTNIRQKLMITTRHDIAWHLPDDVAARVRQDSTNPPNRPDGRPRP